MLPLKKKMFGYDTAQVDIALKELNDEVFSLRQELFTAEKKWSDSRAEESGQSDQDRVQLLGELDDLKKQLKQREHELALLAGQINSQPSNGGALETEIAEYRDALSEMDRILAEKNAAIASMESAIAQLKVQYENAASKRTTPDLKMIEKIYMRAFVGARDIAEEAKENICDLTSRVHSELTGSVRGSAGIYEELLSAKHEMETFIAQGMGHFKALEKMLASISEVDMKTPTYIKKLDDSKAKILNDVEASLGAFDIELEEKFSAPEEIAPAADVIPQVFVPEVKPAASVDKVTEPHTDNNAEVRQIIAAAQQAAAEQAAAQQVTVPEPPVQTEEPEIAEPVKAEDEYEDDMYDPADELNDMKEAIKRELAARKQAETSGEFEAPEDIVSKTPAEPHTVNPSVQTEEAEQSQVKAKVNIQDILKKYSNVNS